MTCINSVSLEQLRGRGGGSRSPGTAACPLSYLVVSRPGLKHVTEVKHVVWLTKPHSYQAASRSFSCSALVYSWAIKRLVSLMTFFSSDLLILCVGLLCMHEHATELKHVI